jgi:phosphate transport system substrate-binding protein
MKKVIALALLAGAVVAGSAAAATSPSTTAAPSALSGTITADGSSTLGPYTSAAAEGFQKRNRGVRITVGISGTGGGFERFCRGEIDLANASRPMRNTEAIRCRDAGVKWVAFTVANDGLSVVVNNANTWASCLTVAELKKFWEPGSNVNNWSQVRAGFPDVSLKLFGAGTDSGTFDYFTEAINGRARASRSDYLATEDDNIVVQGVSGERGGLGYFGLSYLESNRSKLKGLEIDGGDGCVAPTSDTVQDGTYKPLSRPLFVYAKASSLERLEVDAFLQFMLDNQERIAKAALFVPLTEAQLSKSRTQLEGGSTDAE